MEVMVLYKDGKEIHEKIEKVASITDIEDNFAVVLSKENYFGCTVQVFEKSKYLLQVQ